MDQGTSQWKDIWIKSQTQDLAFLAIFCFVASNVFYIVQLFI